MSKKIKIFSILLVLILLTANTRLVYANSGKAVSMTDYIQIPKSVQVYVTENKERILNTTNMLISMSSNVKCDLDLYLGKPYIVCDMDVESQYEIYYYPIIEKESAQIVYMLSIIGTCEGYTHCITGDMVSELNEMNYLTEECFVFRLNNELYIENTSQLLNTKTKECSDRNAVYMTEMISLNTLDKKKEYVQGVLELFKPFSITQVSEEDLKNIKSQGVISLYRPQGQYGYGMCWASAAATIINCLSNRVVTGFDICNHLGIGYNDGGTLYDVSDGLNYYGIYYNEIRASRLDLDEIKNNIDEGYPFVILAKHSDYYPTHDVVAHGYSGTTIYIWDSYANGGSGGYATFEYSNSGSCVSLDGLAYGWLGTLAYE